MSKSVFDANPNVNELFSFEDGTCFYINELNNAINYAKKSGLEYKIIKRENEEKQTTKPKK